MRVTDISCVNFTSHSSTAPEIGAAEEGFGRGGERDVTFAREQSRGRIQAHPSGARQIHFGPGVQIGEILPGPGLALERFHVGLQLDQIAGDEARGESQMTQDFHQQPGAVAAGAAFERQRLFARLDARLHPNEISDLVLQLLVQVDQKIVGTLLGEIDGLQIRGQLGTGRADFAKRRELVARAPAHNRTEISRRRAPGKSRMD